MGLDFLCQKTRIITPNKQTVQPGDAIEDTAFKPGVWNCQIINQVVESQLFTFLSNRYHQWLSDIELTQIRACSASYFRMNSCSPAGKRIGVGDCHANCWHRKTTIFTSILYRLSDLIWVLFNGYGESANEFHEKLTSSQKLMDKRQQKLQIRAEQSLTSNFCREQSFRSSRHNFSKGVVFLQLCKLVRRQRNLNIRRLHWNKMRFTENSQSPRRRKWMKKRWKISTRYKNFHRT